MFSKDDYQQYFRQIASLERFMLCNVYDLLSLLDDEKLREVLEPVAKDEVRHYGYLKEIFDSILLQDKVEKRSFLRVNSLGKVKIKVNDEEALLEAYCVNISSAGICIESNQKINPGDMLELWVDFFDGLKAQHHFGTLVWRAEIDADLQIERIRYRAGVQFHSPT